MTNTNTQNSPTSSRFAPVAPPEYWAELAQALRANGNSEAAVLRIMCQLRDEAQCSGVPVDARGSARVVASTYWGGAVSPGRKALNVSGAVGLLCVLGWIVVREHVHLGPVVDAFGGVMALVVVVLVGAFIGSSLDHRLPRGFEG